MMHDLDYTSIQAPFSTSAAPAFEAAGTSGDAWGAPAPSPAAASWDAPAAGQTSGEGFFGDAFGGSSSSSAFSFAPAPAPAPAPFSTARPNRMKLKRASSDVAPQDITLHHAAMESRPEIIRQVIRLLVQCSADPQAKEDK